MKTRVRWKMSNRNLEIGSIKRLIRSFYNARLWSNRELRKVCHYLPDHCTVINVSGWKDADKEGGSYRDYFPSPQVYHVANYQGDAVRGANVPSDLFIDLQQLLPARLVCSYDVVLNHTVLEHVPDPGLAFAQLAKLTRGVLITVVPFKQALHFEEGSYGDYFRLTPFSMRRMHENSDLIVVYESYTPLPSHDTYLFYVGVRSGVLPQFPKKVLDLHLVNKRMGQVNIWASLFNVVRALLRLT